MSRVGWLADRRVIRRAAEQALTVPALAQPANGSRGLNGFAPTALADAQLSDLDLGRDLDFALSAPSRPRYHTAPVKVAVVIAAAALVVAGVLLIMRPWTGDAEEPTGVAPTGSPSPSPALTPPPPTPVSELAPSVVPAAPPPPVSAATMDPPAEVSRPQSRGAEPAPEEAPGDDEGPAPIEAPPPPEAPDDAGPG